MSGFAEGTTWHHEGGEIDLTQPPYTMTIRVRDDGLPLIAAVGNGINPAIVLLAHLATAINEAERILGHDTTVVHCLASVYNPLLAGMVKAGIIPDGTGAVLNPEDLL